MGAAPGAWFHLAVAYAAVVSLPTFLSSPARPKIPSLETIPGRTPGDMPFVQALALSRLLLSRSRTHRQPTPGTRHHPHGWLIAWDLFALIGHRRCRRHWPAPDIRNELVDT